MAKSLRIALFIPMICLAALCFGGIRPRAITIVPSDAVEYNGHYYMIYDDLNDFDDPSFSLAKKLCRKRGGHLAVLTDAEECGFLQEYLNKTDYAQAFFGLQLKDGEWLWADDTPYVFENWADGEPDGDGEEPHGMLLNSRNDGKWSDGRFGESSMVYICEWDKGEHISGFDMEYAKKFVPENTVEHNGSRYRVFNSALERNEAANFCRDMGGHLVSITSEEENEFVKELIASEGKRAMYWIGAYYVKKKDSWRWLSNEAFDYTAWSGGDPKYYTYDVEYAAINAALDKYDVGDWAAETAIGKTDMIDEYYTNFGFICEWEIICGDNFYHGQYERLVETEPTCTSGGLVKFMCTECGEEISNASLSRLAHNYIRRPVLWKLYIPGIETEACTICGDTVRIIEPGKIWFVPVFLLIAVTMIVSFFAAWRETEAKPGTAAKRSMPPFRILLMMLLLHGILMMILYLIFIR